MSPNLAWLYHANSVRLGVVSYMVHLGIPGILLLNINIIKHQDFFLPFAKNLHFAHHLHLHCTSIMWRLFGTVILSDKLFFRWPVHSWWNSNQSLRHPRKARRIPHVPAVVILFAAASSIFQWIQLVLNFPKYKQSCHLNHLSRNKLLLKQEQAAPGGPLSRNKLLLKMN